MKSFLSTLLISSFIVSSSLFSIACDNKASGVLIPLAEDGIQIGDTNTKNDTVQISSGDLKISVFGGWVYNFTKPSSDKNERASFDFTFTIENKGKFNLDLDFDIKQSAISGRRIESFRQLSVSELVNSKDTGLTTLSEIRSDKITIKPGEKKIYVDYFTASIKDENTIEKDEVVYELPAGLTNGKDLIIRFKCISSSDIEYIRSDPQRPQNIPSN